MMKNIIKLLTLIISGIAFSTALSWPGLSGNDLLKYCNAEINFTDHDKNYDSFDGLGLICIAYIDGVSNAMLGSTNDQFANCYINFYRNVSAMETVRVVVKALNAKPSWLHYDAVSLTKLALLRAFPIPKKCQHYGVTARDILQIGNKKKQCR